MKASHHTGILISALLALFMLIFCPLNAQEPDGQPDPDSIRVEDLYARALNSFSEGAYHQTLNILGEALQRAMPLNAVQPEAKILELIGDTYVADNSVEEALPYYLRVVSIFEYAGDSTSLKEICTKTGDAYSRAGAHENAEGYYLRSMEMQVDTDLAEKAELSRKLGSAALLSNHPEKARKQFLDYEALLKVQDKDPVPAYTLLLNACRQEGDLDGCMSYAQKLLEHYRSLGNDSTMALLYNNMGHYLTEQERFAKAVEDYTLAIKHAGLAGFGSEKLAVMEANLGACYQNMDEPDLAMESLNGALDRLKKKDIPAERSRIENMQALLYYHENDLYNAGFFCQEAISSAGKANDSGRLAEAYLTYSRVLRAGNDPINALKYYESYLAIRDSLQLEQKMERQKLEEKIARLDRSEKDLMLRLKEEKVNELTINRLTMKLKQEEQARQLLLKENDLQQLEQERLKQSMVITEQQHRVEQQERQNRLLEQEQKIANLALEREQQKQKESEQEIRLLEQQQKMDQLSLEKQKAQRKLLIGVVLLMVIIVILVTASLITTRNKNLLLARQKKEIQAKNRDLEFKNEEISAQRDEIEAQRDEIEAQRDLVFKQKEDIEQYSMEITQSIEYAKRIQTAALPDLESLRKAVSDYFVLFRPRDIVSGDFYWMAHVEDTTVLVVADCTGHGVPGAFMSMLGMSLLKEIVQKEYVTHPGVILRRARKEVMRSLRQKGTAGEQRDGMDMSLIEIRRKEKQIRYAGAFNSLYLVRNSRLDAPDIPDVKVMIGERSGDLILYEIPADRMPVAFFDRMDKFTTHSFSIREGDQLYMFTDGFPDQFGGEHGKKFKYKPFKELILENASLPLEDQHRILDATLDRWKGSYDQVDDICVIGVRL